MSRPTPDSPPVEDSAPGHDDEDAKLDEALPDENEEPQDEEDHGQDNDDVLPLDERIKREEQSRRLREESLRTLYAGEDLTVGRDWFGDSTVRAGHNSSVTFANRDVHYHESADGPPVRSASIPAAYLERLKSCLVPTTSQMELATRLPKEPVLLLSGEKNTGRKATAIGALRPIAEDCHVMFIRGEPEQVNASRLKKDVGYILVGDDQPWLSRIGEVIDHLAGVTDECGCYIIVLVPPACGLTRRVVIHDAPSIEEVFRRWFSGELRDPDAWVRYGMDAYDVGRRLTGCTPDEAATTAQRVAQGLLSNRPVDKLLNEQPLFAAKRLREDLKKDKTKFGRCFLVSSAVLHDLPEPVVSEVALDLAERVSPKEQEDEEVDNDANWEQLESWLKYSGIETQSNGTTGEGRRVHLRDGFARHLLPTIWQELPAIRKHFYEWLRELARRPDAHVQIKVAHAVGLLATCDFEMASKEFLHDWSRASASGPKRLAAMALEAAGGYPEIRDKVYRLLHTWVVTGSYEQRTTAAIAYGSRLGAGHVDVAMKLLHQVSLPTDSHVLCDIVASSIVNLYSPDTADVILDELTRWARGTDYGPRLAAAFALIWLSGRLISPWMPTVRREDSRLADLWINALHLSIARRHQTKIALDFAGGVWQTLGDWLRVYPHRPWLQPVLEFVFQTAGTLHAEYRKVYEFHLLAWRHRQVISAALAYHLSNLLRKG